DRVCVTRGGSFFEVFNNQTGACDLDCSMIADPGSASDCSEPFLPPILADLDGDGQTSCNSSCVADTGDIAKACGVTLPFPPCNPLLPVVVEENQDCSAGDTKPGNNRCDLAPGIYGAVAVRRGGRHVLGSGTNV